MKSMDRNVKFYPPVWNKLREMPNINFLVNYAVAEKLGVRLDIVEAYSRKKDHNDDT